MAKTRRDAAPSSPPPTSGASGEAAFAARAVQFLTTLAERQERADGWSNEWTGLGDASRDPSEWSRFSGRALRSREELERLYAQNAIAGRVIDLPAFDATRRWIKLDVPNDDDGNDVVQLISDELTRLGARQKLREGLAWARLYGGAIGVLGLDDGATDLSQPLNEARVRSFRHIEILDRHQAYAGPVETDSKSPWFGKPRYYVLYPETMPSASGELSGHTFAYGTHIHASRVLRFGGVKVPHRLRLETLGWDWSVYDRIFEEVRDWGESKRWLAATLKDATVDVYQISNLVELLSSGKEDQVRKRFQLINMAKSVLRAVVIGKEEHYEKRVANVTGYTDLMREFMVVVAGAAGIPVTRLFGISPAGLNATGESDIRTYYDFVAGQLQEDELRPQLQRIIDLITINRGGPIGRPMKVGFTWNPLWELDELDRADVYAKTAAADKNYIDLGVLLPHEVALSRFGGQRGQVQIDEKLREEEREVASTRGQPGGAGGAGAPGASASAEVVAGALDIVEAVDAGRIARPRGLVLLQRLAGLSADDAEAMLEAEGEAGGEGEGEDGADEPPDAAPPREDRADAAGKFEEGKHKRARDGKFAEKPTGSKANPLIVDGYSFVKSPRARRERMKIILVDPRKVDAEWAKDLTTFVGPRGEGGIDDRYSKAKEFIESSGPKKPIEMPTMYFKNPQQPVGFIDGRHRFRVLADQGVTAVPVSVLASDARALRKRFAPDDGDEREAVLGIASKSRQRVAQAAKAKAAEKAALPVGPITHPPESYRGSPTAPTRGTIDHAAMRDGLQLVLDGKPGYAEGSRTVRREMNNALAGLGMYSNDEMQGRSRKDRFEVRPLVGSLGVHEWNGEIKVTRPVALDAQRFFDGARDREAIRGAKVLFHEAIHGHTPMHINVYQGAARWVEEATTELGAKHVMTKVFGVDAFEVSASAFSYHEQIHLTATAVRHAVPARRGERMTATMAFLGEVAVRMRSKERPPLFEPQEYLHLFAEAVTEHDHERKLLVETLNKTMENYKG